MIEQQVIVGVIAIGKRGNLAVYQTMLKRIRSTS